MVNPRKRTGNRKVFPLLNEIADAKNYNLFDSNAAMKFSLGEYIKENLKHTLRRYQQDALFSLNYTQTGGRKYDQLLFNMATGSGKTDIMAAIILYMYVEHDYRNFLFVANTNAVVNKTKENFLNENSSKYLFKSQIFIDGKRIEIREVQRYPANQEPGVIYLKLTTIQSLANELGSLRENGLTYEELEKQKLVILADEAHHFNARTKKEEAEENSWESLLDNIRYSNDDNRQFEFTATIDIDKKAVYEKYRDKIAYKYELNQFMNDGYSKKVYRLEANNDDKTKMLNAVLLSQYRKRLAKEAGIEDFKPVILFKSNRVAISEQTKNVFLEMINNLDIESFTTFLTEQQNINQSSALKKAYDYWLKQDHAETIRELKHDFQPLTTINVNDTAKDGILGDKNDFYNLNTLEDSNNPLRTVFAVAKLTEGWDVLNLYDIVRIGEQPVTSTQTNSEAQLIGRGARYNPFVYSGKKSYVRRFDEGNPNLSLLESLYYHTINDVKYIGNLVKSFDKMNLVSENDNENDYQIYTAQVKESFKKSKAYKYGNLYRNQIEDVPVDTYKNLGSYGVNNNVITIDINDSTLEHDYTQVTTISEASSKEITIADFSTKHDQRLLKKALSKDTFYRFNELSKWIPEIKSMKEFINSSNWLGALKVRAVVPYNRMTVDNLTKLDIVSKALTKIKRAVKANYHRKRGTRFFEPIPIREVVTDYQKRISQNKTGNSIQTLIQPEPMDKDKWFVYDTAIVDRLEKGLIDLVRNFIVDLKQAYSEVFLIRNEETMNKLKLYEFESDSEVLHYEGFMPDFLLYLDDGSVNYQLYVEPKGDQLLERDQWKENLLQHIRPENIVVVGENKDVKLYGVKFYVSGDRRKIEDEILEYTAK